MKLDKYDQLNYEGKKSHESFIECCCIDNIQKQM